MSILSLSRSYKMRWYCAALSTALVLAQAEDNPLAPGPKVPTAPDAAPKRRTFPPASWVEPDHEAPNGTQYKTFASKVLGQDVSYLIYLPPGYEESSARYPVIYWLHGMGGNQRAGASVYVPKLEAAIRAGTMPPVIVVLPNGMVTSFYCDSVDGKHPVESVIIKDLIPHIDATYRTQAKREARIIEGFSMGGYGAAHLGFKYPELFGTVIVDSGALLDPHPAMAAGGPMPSVFGTDNDRRLAEHPETLAAKNAGQLRGHTNIRIGCGSDDSLLPRNKSLHDVLDQLKIEHTYIIVPGVAHNPPLFYRTLGDKCFAFHQKALSGLSP